MNTTHRTTLTATLATAAALSITGVSWGIAETVESAAGPGTATTAVVTRTPATVTLDPLEADATDASRGPGHGAGSSPGIGGHGRGRGRGAAPEAGQGGAQARGHGGVQGRGHGGAPGDGPGGRGSAGAGNHGSVPPAVAGTTITDAVRDQLSYLVEEEKLAGDVYALGESLYSARVFSNIARAEDAHTEEVRVLLDRYGVVDPTLGAAPGQFTDPDLQALYDTLAAQVRSSWADAVAAGIMIEQADIADLEQLLGAEGLPTDVRVVAGNLLAGSQRHLAAFQRQGA
jgi:hypothetical protein